MANMFENRQIFMQCEDGPIFLSLYSRRKGQDVLWEVSTYYVGRFIFQFGLLIMFEQSGGRNVDGRLWPVRLDSSGGQWSHEKWFGQLARPVRLDWEEDVCLGYDRWQIELNVEGALKEGILLVEIK